MAEYIEREAAFHAICYSCADSCVDLLENNGKCKRGNRYCDEGKALDAIPAADVAPMRHGRWVVSRTDYGWNGAEFPTHCKCDRCGREVPYQDRDNYCPNCGARMDGDGE